MKKMTTGTLTFSMVTTLMLLALFCSTSVLAADKTAADFGVAYRGHIQDIGNYPTDENTWIQGPEELGTEGRSLRLEGFQIKLTGTIPAGAHIKYNVHVQDVGWLYSETDTSSWAQDGDFAGTTARSLRIEAVKIILTDADGNALPGYSVEYRGHIQNKGDAPLDGTWLKDCDQLGTVGESLRLEALDVKIVRNPTDLTAYNALLASINKSVEKDYTATSWTTLQKVMTDNVVSADTDQIDVNQATAAIQTAFNGLVKKQATVVYDKAGTYGPATGTETVTGDVIIKADGVVLQNLTIQGDLTVAAEVGNGTVTLNNINVAGDTFVRGGGVNSIHINGGTYHNVTVEKTATGQVRIVATDAQGLAVVISEDATGQSIVLEGAFASVVVNAPNMTVSTQGDTTIVSMTVSKEGAGSTLTFGYQTKVNDLVLDGKTGVKGQGTVTRAEVGADGVTYEKAPTQQTVDPVVVVPPVVTPPDPGGGYTTVPVTGITITPASGSLAIGDTLQLIATVAPGNATNQNVDWTSLTSSIATVDATGLVTPLLPGTATIMATSMENANISVSCNITVTTEFGLDSKGMIVAYYGKKTDVMIPSDIGGVAVTGIGDFAFNASSITCVAIPASVTTIGPSAFKGCPLAAVNFAADSKLTAIGANAFEGTRLTAIQIPAGVTTVGSSAFNNCLSLTGVSFAGDSKLTTIGDSAFAGTQLTAIQIPAGVTSIGSGAFPSYGLTTITFNGDAPTTMAADAIRAGATIKYYAGCTGFGVSPWNDSTKAYKFTVLEVSPITDTTINGVTEPAVGATLVDKTTDDAQFTGAVGWSGGTTSNIFTGSRPYIATITLTANTGYAFPAGINFIVNGGTTSTSTASDGKTATVTVSFPLPTTGQYVIDNGGQITAYYGLGGNVIIPDTVNSVTVTGIGDNAFINNKSLTAITIPANVTSIGDSAFQGCIQLETVNFGTGSVLKTIGVLSFYNCPLKTIQIPARVESIGNAAFSLCTALKTVEFESSSELKTIGNFAFQNCVGLTTIQIPARVESIGEGAFDNCSKLGSVGFDTNSVLTTIGAGAFDACSNLTTITFNGNAPVPANIGTNAIPTSATIHYYANKTGFDAAAWPGYTLVPILAAPANLTVISLALPAGEINLYWTAVTGATSYTIKYWTLSETDAATFTIGPSTTYPIGGLISGTTYHFTVTATDAIGGSLPSATVDVILN